jgi:hypothetical protein
VKVIPINQSINQDNPCNKQLLLQVVLNTHDIDTSYTYIHAHSLLCSCTETLIEGGGVNYKNVDIKFSAHDA